MKARMHFDTLTYANKLKAAGMEPELAEAQALALGEAIEEGIATKSDVLDLKNELKTDIGQLKTDLAQLKAEVKTDMAKLKSDLVQWMRGLFITNITLLGAFIAFAQFLNHSH